MDNKGFKYYYDPTQGHTAYLGKDNDKSFVDYSDMRELNKYLISQKERPSDINNDKKNSDTYYFEDRRSLLNAISLLKEIL
jgi:hypothetical protein